MVRFAAAGLVIGMALSMGSVPARAAEPVYNWTGFYVGLQGGGMWGHKDLTEYVLATGAPTGFRRNFTYEGAFGGAHLGYNAQVGTFVFGLEADAEITDVDGDFVTAIGLHFSSRQHWQASLRARIGFTPVERLLAYVTAGAAFTRFTHDWDLRPAGIPAAETFRTSASGFTIGAGAEYALTRQISVRGEWRYTDYGTLTFDWPLANGFYRLESNMHAVRGAISYRFAP
jgi:outer membrane immunogenic protein